MCAACVCDTSGTVSCVNFDLVRTNSPHGDQRLVLMRQHVISEVLVKVKVRLSSMNGSQCNVLTRIAARCCVCACVEPRQEVAP